MTDGDVSHWFYLVAACFMPVMLGAAVAGVALAIARRWMLARTIARYTTLAVPLVIP